MTKILYFSGSGNSLWSAKRIAAIIGGECELFNIGVEAKKNKITLEADAIVLLFPSYAYGLPPVVHHFVKMGEFKTMYLAAFVTFGTSPGGTLAECSRLLKKKSVGSSFFGRIPAVENYYALFGPQKPEKIERRTAMQKEATDMAARCVIERRVNRVNPFRPFSSLVSFLFSLGVHNFYKCYRVSADCNACGICEKICPVSAVVMRNGRPVFCEKCEHCQGCVNICPLRAIHFGRVNSNTPVYHHPEISVSDLSK